MKILEMLEQGFNTSTGFKEGKMPIISMGWKTRLHDFCDSF